MSRRRRIRRQSFDDSNDIIDPNEVYFKLFQTDEYIDFKNYPLSIDWKDIENDDSAARIIFYI